MKVARNKKRVVAEEMILDLEMENISPYQAGIDFIMNAIDCLGEAAKSGDEKARDAIANLSVVLLDLKS